MKKSLICLLAIALLGASTLYAGEPVKNGDEPVKTTKAYTFKELKAKYGENLIIANGTFQDEDVIQVQENPAPGDCNGRPCRAAIAQASKQLQAEANACCCSFAAGIVCCEGGLFVEYLVLFEPDNGCTP